MCDLGSLINSSLMRRDSWDGRSWIKELCIYVSVNFYLGREERRIYSRNGCSRIGHFYLSAPGNSPGIAVLPEMRRSRKNAMPLFPWTRIVQAEKAFSLRRSRGIPGARRHRDFLGRSRSLGQKLSRGILCCSVTPSETGKRTPGIAAEETTYKKMALPGIPNVKIAPLTFLGSVHFMLTFPATASVAVS